MERDINRASQDLQLLQSVLGNTEKIVLALMNRTQTEINVVKAQTHFGVQT